jgi:hypothetical protein
VRQLAQKIVLLIREQRGQRLVDDQAAHGQVELVAHCRVQLDGLGAGHLFGERHQQHARAFGILKQLVGLLGVAAQQAWRCHVHDHARHAQQIVAGASTITKS